MQKLVNALRFPFLIASFLPAAAAGALAVHDGNFSALPFFIVSFAVLCAHAGTNLANDYFDYKAGNYPKVKKGPTGGSFAIQNKDFSSEQVYGMSLACFALSLALFAYLAAQVSPIVLMLGAAGVAIGFFYTAPPIKLGYRVLGELATFVGMGPLLFETVYFATTGTFSAAGLLISAFLGVLVLNILLAAQVPDIEVDQASRKHTISAKFGPSALYNIFLLANVFAALALIASVAWYGLPSEILMALLGSVVAFRAYSLLTKEKTLDALGSCLNALQIGGVLLVLALIFRI